MKLINSIRTRTRITLENLQRRIGKIHRMGDIRSVTSSSSLPSGSSSSNSEAPIGISILANDPMRKESNRLGTFKQATDVDKDILAERGFFFHERIPSKVQCYACGVRIDYPLKFPSSRLDSEHSKLNKECLFLRGLACNVSVPTKVSSENSNNHASDIPRGHDCTGTHIMSPESNNNRNNNDAPRITSVLTDRQQVHPGHHRMLPSLQSRNEQLNPYSRPAVNFESMKSEDERLRSFRSNPPWPVSFIRPEDCARAGFFSLKEGDKVQCAFCRGVAGEWEPEDIPLVEHERHFPRCPFICNVPVGNIPIGQEQEGDDDDEDVSSEESEQPYYNMDICGPFDPSVIRANNPAEAARIRGPRRLSGGSFDDIAANLSVKACRGPSNLNMVTPQARLKSFTDMKWPASAGQSPEGMAEAGFYYLGCQDHVKCFYCDGGLRNWEAIDEPWVEHARWFPLCTFVLLNKGEAFINRVSQEGSSEETAVSSSSSSTSPNSSQNQNGSARLSTSSSDEEEMETVLGQEKNADIDVPSSSGVSSGSSDRSSRNSDTHESTSSGNSSADEDETIVSKNKFSKEKVLEEEVRKLREARQCKICMDNEVSVVFLPCGHLVSCTKCATAFSKCALCREPIKAFVRTYMS